MSLNKNRQIRIYLLTIALMGGFVFVVFVLANVLTTQQNARRIQTMQDKEFPIIQTLIDLEQESVKLRKSFGDAIAYENYFLVTESMEQSKVVQAKIDRLNYLYERQTDQTLAIEDALISYTKNAANLASVLLNEEGSLDKHYGAAQHTNTSFEALHTAIKNQLELQQTLYVEQLILLDKNLRYSTITATGVGLLLLTILFGLTYYITGKILEAVKRADTLKEAFLNTISHELRTPLTGIYGTLNLLESAETDAERHELITLGQTASRTMNKLVDDIILFSELMSGQNRVITSQFEIKQSLEEVLKLIRAQCKEKGLIFECDIITTKIESDERKITRTLGHLLENAVKYTEQGHVRLQITEEKTELTVDNAENTSHQGLLKIVVEDTGPGIEPSYLNQIFSPFEQGNSAWNRKFQGMGLGLPMSHLLIQSLNGQISIKNRDGILGVHAEVAIPCIILQPTPTEHNTGPEIALQPPAQTVFNNAASTPSPQDSKTIQALIVEDNKTNQLILQRVLKNQGVNTLIANNGAEALDIMATQSFDVIFMDCQMPVMDGFEATTNIRQRESADHRTPIIAVTANTRDTDKERCFAVGMDDFLEKPVNLSNIKRTLEKYVNKKPQ